MGMWVNEGIPTMSFVLYTINVEYLCDESTDSTEDIHVIFVRKYKTFQKIYIPWARFYSSGTSFFPKKGKYKMPPTIIEASKTLYQSWRKTPTFSSKLETNIKR